MTSKEAEAGALRAAAAASESALADVREASKTALAAANAETAEARKLATGLRSRVAELEEECLSWSQALSAVRAELEAERERSTQLEADLETVSLWDALRKLVSWSLALDRPARRPEAWRRRRSPSGRLRWSWSPWKRPWRPKRPPSKTSVVVWHEFASLLAPCACPSLREDVGGQVAGAGTEGLVEEVRECRRGLAALGETLQGALTAEGPPLEALLGFPSSRLSSGVGP